MGSKTFRFEGSMADIQKVYQGNTFNFGKQSRTSDLHRCIQRLRQCPESDREMLIPLHPAAEEGLCEWVLNDETFRQWTSEKPSSHLNEMTWYCDRERMGKTTLAIFVSKHLERTLSNNSDSWVLYYFCDKNQDDRATASSIMRGFILQLYEKHHKLATPLRKADRRHGSRLYKPDHFRYQWRVFRAMVNDAPAKRIFCIVDGLDKCEGTTLRDFLLLLRRYFEARDKRELDWDTSDRPRVNNTYPIDGKLRMMIMTRECPEYIVKKLGIFPRLPPHADLQGFIDVSIKRVATACAEKKGFDERATDAIAQTLGQGEKKDFLWISLVARRLSLMTQTQIQKYVEKVPGSVVGMHIQTLQNIPRRRHAQVSAILKFVGVATRPLSVLELTKAIKYSLKTNFTRRTLRNTLKLCFGLVHEQNNIVTYEDPNLHDLLFDASSPLRGQKSLRHFVFEKSKANADLMNVCVTYLQESANLEKSRRVRLRPGDVLKSKDEAFLRKHPFLAYAIASWPMHARQSDGATVDFDHPFFSPNSVRRRRWWESYWISLRRSYAWKWTAPGNFSLLHMAAFFDIVPLAQHVEKAGRVMTLLQAEDDQGMKPINWSMERAQVDVALFLLEHGSFDDRALRQAARMGNASIVTKLLENRTQLLRSPSLAGTPSTPISPLQLFRKATQITLSSISDLSKKADQALNPNPAPLSPLDQGYGRSKSETPLHIAATSGHDVVVAALLDAGENCDAPTDGGWTALHNAAWCGHLNIVERLVAAGADVTAQTKEKLTPLHCAVRNDQAVIVERLLSTPGVDKEARDIFGLTPFHMACKRDNIEIMDILIDYHANIEARMRQGWTSLLWGCIHGRIRIVRRLLEKGADVHARWVYKAGAALELGALALARAYQQQDIVRLLEKYGMNEPVALTNTEVETLPTISPTAEESYDLPDGDIVGDTISEDGMSQSDNDGESDDSDTAESIGDEDSDGDGSEIEIDLLQQTLGDDLVCSPQPSRSRVFDMGLGISLAAENNVYVDSTTGEHGVSNPHHQEHGGNGEADGGSIFQGCISADLVAKGEHISQVAEASTSDVCANDTVHNTTNDTVNNMANDMANDAAPTEKLDRRSSSVAALAGNLNDRFRRFTIKKVK